MGNENWSNARYWEPSEAASVADGTKALTASITPYLVPKFADVTARNSAAAAWLAEPGVTTLEGLRCYVVSRKGHCTHYGALGWEWDAQCNKVAGKYQASNVNSASTSPGTVFTTDPYVLPSGNRLVQISARGVVTNLSGTTHNVGRLMIMGAGVPDGLNWMEATVAPGRESTVTGQWFQVLSGTVNLSLTGLAISDASGVSFTHTFLQAFDLGPTDD